MRLIDADAIIEKKWQAESEACFYALEDVVSVTDIEEAPTIEVSEDCISRSELIERLVELIERAESPYLKRGIRWAIGYAQSAPSVVPSRAEGEWQITEAYPHNVYCSECHKRFAQTHWGVWEDGSLPRNYCPNCGAKMKG